MKAWDWINNGTKINGFSKKKTVAGNDFTILEVYEELFPDVLHFPWGRIGPVDLRNLY